MSSQVQSFDSTRAGEEPARNYAKASLSFILLRWLVRFLLKVLFRVEVCGFENLPRQGGYILAGNHLSWLDPFLMLTFMPAEPRIYFIAAKENMECTHLRAFITSRVGGVIGVERNSQAAPVELNRKVNEVLAGGGVLGIFPEGTVAAAERGRVLPFKKGLGYFAVQSGQPVVPVAFSGTKEPWLRKRVVMIIGEPLPGRRGNKEAAESLLAETARAIEAILPAPVPENPRTPKLLRGFFTNLFIKKGKMVVEGE